MASRRLTYRTRVLTGHNRLFGRLSTTTGVLLNLESPLWYGRVYWAIFPHVEIARVALLMDFLVLRSLIWSGMTSSPSRCSAAKPIASIVLNSRSSNVELYTFEAIARSMRVKAFACLVGSESCFSIPTMESRTLSDDRCATTSGCDDLKCRTMPVR